MTLKLNAKHGLIVLLLIFCTGCTSSLNRQAKTDAQVSTHTLVVGGVTRSYFLDLPPASQRDGKYPLVLVLHGGGRGDGLSVAKHFGLSALAARDGSILVYPNGLDGFWRDGRDQRFRDNGDRPVDDVAFISALIDRLIAQQRVDPKRVYVTGISNGGMMAFRLGCELSQKLTAIAPVAASMPSRIYRTCQPARSLPVLVMNGTQDPMVPYTGGYVHFYRQKRGAVVSTEQAISFWQRQNACHTERVVQLLPDINLRDDSRVQWTRFGSEGSFCGVELYTVLGGGHTFPGSQIPDIPMLLGHKNQDIDGAQVIWAFFQRSYQE
ncbi:prolyl oligopeptidase family serine peptidase [Photobacterium sp. GJ3]|uniref:alpha/beta hydrolase family esterase n=1 Tax=Photobacterium sp. GJ3 TaxID=2829502 RepID=UPI001B8A9871|nr:PHB depolymerase family esterase [Photobacterium sp. GJ3]QUJ66503.1 prolyl oligopeptidase family serine peptidase [Photobacterium sp. GJ3]